MSFVQKSSTLEHQPAVAADDFSITHGCMQTLHGQPGMSSGSGGSGVMLQGEPHDSSGLGSIGFPDFIQGSGSKRNLGSMSGAGRDRGESLHLKRGDGGN